MCSKVNRKSQNLSPLLKIRECPKILNNKVSDKMSYANSADPDQTEGAV